VGPCATVHTIDRSSLSHNQILDLCSCARLGYARAYQWSDVKCNSDQFRCHPVGIAMQQAPDTNCKTRFDTSACQCHSVHSGWPDCSRQNDKFYI